jgi:hypothetical protein
MRTIQIRAILVSIGTASLPTWAFAQDCDAILQDGLWNYHVYQGASSAESRIQARVCETHRDGGSLSGSIGPVSLDKLSAEDLDKMCSANSQTSAQSQEARVLWRDASEIIVSAWENCKNNGGGGLHLYGEVTQDGKDFLLSVSYSADVGTVGPATLEYQTRGLTCERLPTRITNGNRITTLCTRDPRSTSIIVMNADGFYVNGRNGSNSLQIAPLRAPPAAIPSFISALRVTISTSDVSGASTDSRAWLTVGDARVNLGNANQNDRQRGRIDVYLPTLEGTRLERSTLRSSPITLHHDDTDAGEKNTNPDWHVGFVEIQYTQAGTTAWQLHKRFDVNDWVRNSRRLQ